MNLVRAPSIAVICVTFCWTAATANITLDGRARRKRGNNFYFLYSAIDLIFHFSVFCVAFVCNALKIISTPRVRHFVGHVTINLAIIHAVNAETRFAWVDGKALIVKKVWNLTKQFLILEMQSFAIHAQNKWFEIFWFWSQFSIFSSLAICKRGCNEEHGSCSVPGDCM